MPHKLFGNTMYRLRVMIMLKMKNRFGIALEINNVDIIETFCD